MTKLHRPYIPLSVRVEVARRQVLAVNPSPFPTIDSLPGESARRHLDRLLRSLFGDRHFALDHDPALCNRVITRSPKTGLQIYKPDANDPRYLVYREAGPVGSGSEHDIKTRVRGENGQLSDLALARKEKRRLRAAAKRQARLAAKPGSGGPRGAKRISGAPAAFKSRPLKSANRWPPRGSRKLGRP